MLLAGVQASRSHGKVAVQAPAYRPWATDHDGDGHVAPLCLLGRRQSLLVCGVEQVGVDGLPPVAWTRYPAAVGAPDQQQPLALAAVAAGVRAVAWRLLGSCSASDVEMPRRPSFSRAASVASSWAITSAMPGCLGQQAPQIPDDPSRTRPGENRSGIGSTVPERSPSAYS